MQLQGDTARMVAGLPLTEANYAHSIVLSARYGQRHKILDAHMRALLERPSPSNSLASLPIFYDSVESYVQGLVSFREIWAVDGEPLVLVKLGKRQGQVQPRSLMLSFQETTSTWSSTKVAFDGKRKQQCIFCKGPHTAHNCDAVTDYK